MSQAARAILAAKDASQLRDSIVLARSANVAQRQNALAKKAVASVAVGEGGEVNS